jgi:hypothetical protein
VFAGFDPTAIFTALQQDASGLISIMGILGLLFGTVVLGKAGVMMIKGDPRTGEAPVGKVIVQALMGGALMQFGATVSMIRGETGGLGSGARSAVMDGMPASGGSALWGVVLGAVFTWLACLGGFAMMRALVMWNAAGSGDSQGGGKDAFWSGFWHLLGGAVCMNIGLSMS